MIHTVREASILVRGQSDWNEAIWISTGALVIRLALGAILLAHGILKALYFPATLAYFGTLGLPNELAYLVAVIEIASGILLIVGIQTRWAAVAVLPGLLGAVWAHLGNGWLFSSNGGGWEYPALLALVQAVTGNSTFSLPSGLRLSWHREESPA